MYSVGLTGGIASGKTTISQMFADLGVPIIDTDIISRKILEPGELAFDQVVTHFGSQILDSSNIIDRAKLRQLVFSDPKEKKWLEAMLHPLIYHHSDEAIRSNHRAAYVLVVVPLLFETNFQSLVDRVLVVDCDAKMQIKRLVERDQIDSDLAQKMLAQQLTNQQRLARAHDIIRNQNDSSDLDSQVSALHETYLKLSGNG